MVAGVVVVVGLQVVLNHAIEVVGLRVEVLNPVVRGAGLAVIVVFVAATVATQGGAPFIYFEF